MKKTILTLVAVFALTLTNAQTAPIGKKTLEVKQSYEGEYMQAVSNVGLSSVVIDALTKRVPDKLKKYGFEDITIIKVGKVIVPVSWSTKLGDLQSKESVALAQLSVATTQGEIQRAVDKAFEEDYDGDWKFQINFTDNTTGKEFKVRLSMMYAPKYIIKESTLEINLR